MDDDDDDGDNDDVDNVHRLHVIVFRCIPGHLWILLMTIL